MAARNPINPWVAGYDYWTPKRGKVSVKSYWTDRGEPSPRPKSRRGRPPKKRGMTARSKKRRATAAERARRAHARRMGVKLPKKRKLSPYNRFVKQFAKTYKGPRTGLMKAAGKAWKKKTGGTTVARPKKSRKKKGGRTMPRRAANPRRRNYYPTRRRRKKTTKRKRNYARRGKRTTRRRRRPNRGTPFRYTVAPVTANPRGTPFRYTVAPVTANRRRRRKYNPRRGNPYVTTARFFENPRALANPAMTAKAFVGEFTKKSFLMNELLPLGGGFVGTKILTGFVIPKLFAPKEGADAAAIKRWETFKKYKWGLEAVMAIVGGMGIGFGLKNTPAAVRFTTGGLLAALVTLLEGQEMYQRYATALDDISINGIGQDVSAEIEDELTKAIEADVGAAQAGMTGIGQDADEYSDYFVETDQDFYTNPTLQAYATDEEMSGIGAYATAEEMSEFHGQGGGISMDAFLAEPAQGI